MPDFNVGDFKGEIITPKGKKILFYTQEDYDLAVKTEYETEIQDLRLKLHELDYKTLRYIGQTYIIDKTGTIDNPKYDNQKSLDNGEMLLVEQEKQEARNKINELEVLLENL